MADAPADARPTDDALWDQTERDNHQKWADKLANAIADHFNVDIGEHSSMNNPWSEAFDAISNAEVSAPADAGEAMTDAARDVLAERRRQVEAEGWTPQHDDEHDMGEMAHVAAWYSIDPMMRDALDERGLGFWPWAQEWWKPTTPRRDLVKAGALILAEIERLDRAARTQGDSHE
ncbi:hypothetical protein WS71_24490 [Burkholderia mayonis]|uniref:Phage protein n=1 Tax=Burkholderia mayonis TaxID=1385591 RepID=A0A1B4G381_9BURK|nr:hypothetical protein WS71_24490 [Burkholderia mayonis]KVE53650.1 hypothetical protein WS71_06290 [Burkholderia mayonis]